MSHLNALIVRLQSEKSKLEGQLKQLTAALDALGSLGKTTPSGRPVSRHRLSASARRRIAAAQRARWAKWKKENRRT